MKNLISVALLMAIIALSNLSSCNKGGDIPPIPDDAIRNTDDLKPEPDRDTGPVPTDPSQPEPPTTPPPTGPTQAVQRISPSDVNPDDVILVYRKMIDPMQLGQISDSRKCHPALPSKCIWNSQVIFGYQTDDLNKNYPKELWEITHIEFTSSFYSLAIKKRDELLCMHNIKMCSGELGKDDDKFIVKNPKFWNGDNDDHIVDNQFTNLLRAHQIEDDLWIVKDHTFDLGKLFRLDIYALRRLFRKNDFISFSVSDDTYVEDPEIKVYLQRRKPRS